MRSTAWLLLALSIVGSGACSGARAPASSAPAGPPYPPGSLTALRVPGPLSTRIASYTIDARLDAPARRITATQTLVWKHTGQEPVTSLPFHLYMNAFASADTVFMRESGGRHRGQRAGEGTWGRIDVTSIRLGENELRPRATFGEDETTLEVPLPAPLAPGAQIELRFEFTTQLPQAFARTGYMGEFMMVGQWFPKIGVLVSASDGTQAWRCETFHLNGEFFADFGSYDVTLDVPAGHVIAATGVLAASSPGEPGRMRHVYRAEDVHDFAWMADPHMRVAQTRTDDGVLVLVYHRPGQAHFAERHLAAARRTIETFSRLFYPYPWSVMSVVDPPPDADGSAGGMEYPTLVTTAGDRALASRGVRVPELVTVHEVGHNWFQGMLASNEVEEAWLDEGVNEYAGGLVLDSWFGEGASVLDVAGLRLGYYDAHRLGTNPDDDAVPIATRAPDFPSFEAYGEQSYYKTTAALKTLENLVGKPRFVAALGAYARAWAFKHPTRRDFFAALEQALGEDLSWFWKPAFEGNGAAVLRVADLDVREHEGKWVSEILVENAGQVPVRVDVRLRFRDGSARRERWDDLRPFKKIRLETAEPVVEVEIDPDHLILLERERLDNARKLDGDAAAAWRAGARVGSWEQTLLQLVGGF